MIETKTNSSKLIETQFKDLLKELLSILSEKWPQSNQTGETLIKSVLNKYSEIYTEYSHDQIEFKQIQAIGECNEIFEKLNALLLNTFKMYVNRMEKIRANLVYIIDLKLAVHQHIDNSGFKSFVNEMLQMFQEDMALKNDLVNKFMSRARLSHESQVNIMSCWLIEPFISHEICSFKLKSYLDSVE
jgi:hypothetical protein